MLFLSSLLLTLFFVNSLAVSKEEAHQKGYEQMLRRLTPQQRQAGDELPFMVFYEEQRAECGQDVTICVASVANPTMIASSIYFEATGQFSGEFVNFQVPFSQNAMTGTCDSFYQAGTLGTTVVQSSCGVPNPPDPACENGVIPVNPDNWSFTSAGTTVGNGPSFTFNNKTQVDSDVLIACDKGRLGTGGTPDCPQNDFYQQVFQLAYTGFQTVDITAVITTSSGLPIGYEGSCAGTKPTTNVPATTDVPPTEEPTTEEPTTEEPTTEEPTTEEPTTEAPTTVEPTTEEPTTEEPTTEEPTTEEPTTEEPTTEEPTTEEPTTEEPTTEEPTTEEPTTEEPTTPEPTTEEPTTEEPTTEAPTTPEPTTEEPTTVEPTTEEPTTVEPTTEEPTTVEPTTEEPTTVEPTTEEPTTVEPTTEEPTTEEPTTEEPTTVEPTTVEPTTVEGQTTECAPWTPAPIEPKCQPEYLGVCYPDVLGEDACCDADMRCARFAANPECPEPVESTHKCIFRNQE